MTCTATGEVSPIASLAAPIADFINSIGQQHQCLLNVGVNASKRPPRVLRRPS
jgi:hypothetical protein